MSYEKEAKEVAARMEQKKAKKELKNIQVLIGRLTLLHQQGYDIQNFVGFDEREVDWASIKPGTRLEIQISKTRDPNWSVR